MDNISYNEILIALQATSIRLGLLTVIAYENVVLPNIGPMYAMKMAVIVVAHQWTHLLTNTSIIDKTSLNKKAKACV